MPDDTPPKPGPIIPTQFRLSDEDKARLDAIQDHFALWSRTDALRMAIDTLFTQIAGKEPEKKNREKYQRPLD